MLWSLVLHLGASLIRAGPEFTRVTDAANTALFRSAEGQRGGPGVGAKRYK